MSGSARVRGTAALSAAAVVAAGVFAALGSWQLGRAEQNRAVAAAFRTAGDAEPVADVQRAADAPDALRYRRLRMEGRYEAGTQILLDNITHNGIAGYYVLTPFRPAGSARHVLVNRGWIEAGPDRSVVPALDVGSESRGVTGRIDRLPRAALRLDASAERVREGLYRLSFPSLADVERLLGSELRPFQLLLDPGAADGFARDWTPRTMSADRNTAYAGQWFIMAVAAAALAVWAALRTYRGMKGNSANDEASP